MFRDPLVEPHGVDGLTRWASGYSAPGLQQPTGRACLLGSIVGDAFPWLILAVGTVGGGYDFHEERGRATEFRVQCPRRTLASHQPEEPPLDPGYASGVELGRNQCIEATSDLKPAPGPIVLAIRRQTSLEHAGAEFVRRVNGGREQVHPHEVGCEERAVVSEQALNRAFEPSRLDRPRIHRSCSERLDEVPCRGFTRHREQQLRLLLWDPSSAHDRPSAAHRAPTNPRAKDASAGSAAAR